MQDILTLPYAPALLCVIAGALLAALGLVQMEVQRWSIAGFWRMPSATGMQNRYGVYQAVALSGAVLMWGGMVAFGIQGPLWWLCLALSVAFYLWAGFVVPGRPASQQGIMQRDLRRSTPAFISYIRIALAGQEEGLTLLHKYVEYPHARAYAMQEIVRDALNLVYEQHIRPFEAMRRVAMDRGCQELVAVTELLAQAEHDGTTIDKALALSEQTIAITLTSEQTRQSKRRSLYLVGAGAIALVVGLLGNVLFVATSGGQLFTGL